MLALFGSECEVNCSWGVIFATLAGTLDGWSHLILKFEAWQIGLEDLFAIGNEGCILFIVGVEWLARKDPVVMRREETVGDAALDD